MRKINAIVVWIISSVLLLFAVGCGRNAEQTAELGITLTSFNNGEEIPEGIEIPNGAIDGTIVTAESKPKGIELGTLEWGIAWKDPEFSEPLERCIELQPLSGEPKTIVWLKKKLIEPIILMAVLSDDKTKSASVQIDYVQKQTYNFKLQAIPGANEGEAGEDYGIVYKTETDKFGNHNMKLVLPHIEIFLECFAAPNFCSIILNEQKYTIENTAHITEISVSYAAEYSAAIAESGYPEGYRERSAESGFTEWIPFLASDKTKIPLEGILFDKAGVNVGLMEDSQYEKFVKALYRSSSPNMISTDPLVAVKLNIEASHTGSEEKICYIYLIYDETGIEFTAEGEGT